MMRVHEKGDIVVQERENEQWDDLIELIKVHVYAILVIGAFICTLGAASTVQEDRSWQEVILWIAGTAILMLCADRLRPHVNFFSGNEEYDDFEDEEDD